MEYLWEHLFQALSSNQFFQGGIVLGAITWVGYQLKAWPVAAWHKLKYFSTSTIYFDDVVGGDFYETFSRWLDQTYPRKFRNVEVRLYWNDTENRGYSEPQVASSYGASGNSDTGWILKRFQYSDSNVIFYAGRWLWVRKTREKTERGGDRALFINSYSVSGFFAKHAIEKLCQDILDQKIAATKKTTLRVGINTEGGGFDWRDVEIVKSLNHIFFQGKTTLINDLEEFVEKRDFYKEKGINFKRSYLFYGPPGTGKTSVGSAIAKHLGFSLYVINLASVKDDLTLQRMATYIGRKSVVLLEDIDCILRDRDVKSDNLNFSTVLSFLDGLYAPSDCVFVLTTNHPEALDAALTRKGRVDLALEIGFPIAEDVQAFMSDFYGAEVRLAVLNGPVSVGMAEIQDICLKNALQDAKQQVTKLFYGSNGHKEASRTPEALLLRV